MTNKKPIKELKKEIKEIDKRIEGLRIEKQTIENKGCLSDHELDERDKKTNALVREIIYLNNEKKFISQSLANIERDKWIKKKGFQKL